MRAVVQRVLEASVEVDGRVVAKINRGLLVLLGVGRDDGPEDVDYMVRKISGLRIFEDGDGKMNLSVKDVGGEVLLVSQFTLYGDVRKGKRPSFDKAAGFEEGKALYLAVSQGLRKEGLKVCEGVYGAMMVVSLKNYGPVTILLDSKKTF